MVTGLLDITPLIEIYKSCVVAKHERNYFSSGKSRRAQAILELIHSDICGLISPASNGNKKYFMTLIDDFYRKTWIYFLHAKSEAFDCFKKFYAIMNTETRRRVKDLRTDRDGEFCSNEFTKCCEEKGIRRQLTVAYTPQQNGVVERKNKTILNMVRSLLNKGEVSNEFWPEVVVWSVHILN